MGADMNYDCVQTGLRNVLVLTGIVVFYFLDDDSFALLHWLTFIQLLLSFNQKFLKQRNICVSLISPLLDDEEFACKAECDLQ